MGLTILQAADRHKARIMEVFDSKDADYFFRALQQVGVQKSAATQCAFAVALLNIRDGRLGITVDLAHEIVMQQLDRCAHFGAGARTLSDKQIRVIADAAGRAIRKDLAL